MRCPKCQNHDDKVIDSRVAREGIAIRRRRECLACAFRFTTYEEIERAEMIVVKRTGGREPFSREKLLRGFIKACEKRTVPLEQLESAADAVVAELESLALREIDSRTIGMHVMEHLHGIDPVAYVRYASVYRQFQEVGEFIEAIHSMERLQPRNAQQPELFS
ncbi:MAG: transcriptional regulator NrdR [Verrucomicrobiota bacterium]